MFVCRPLVTITVGAAATLACTSGESPERTYSSSSSTMAEMGESSSPESGDGAQETEGDHPPLPDAPTQDTDPPVIQSFGVDGGTMPATVEDARFVELAAVVVDDTGLDLVEFQDGDQILATKTNFTHS